MGNILIVAEKPAAGADIAKVVGAAKRGNGYLEGNGYIVTWAVGHLVGLKKPEEHGEEYGKWQLGQLPLSFPLDGSLKILPGTAKQFRIIRELIHRPDVDMLINAGDAGREGYLIQEWIYRMAGCRLPKKVLWASSLTTAGIRTALDHLKDNDLQEFQGLLREAEARAEGDFFLGMNYSRLLTLTRAYGRQTLSYGRCQTPLLNLISIRDAQIENFRSRPYWMIEVRYGKGFKGVLYGQDDKPVHFLDKQEAMQMHALIEKEKSGTVAGYEKAEKSMKAPHLYNLAKLQQDMGRQYNFSPDKTLSIAQSLYETHKILSYPRTDSQFLSMDIFDEIGEHLKCCSFGMFRGLMGNIDASSITADKSYFNDLKVTDHHALIPAINENMEEEYSRLSEEERKVFDAVVLSLIAIFYPEYRYDATTILIRIGDAVFKSSGTTIRELGYKAILKDRKEEEEAALEILPELSEGDAVAVDSAAMPEKRTAAPKPYNDETIIRVMEKYGIGTSATRADIIKKLQNPERQFIVREKGTYKATPLGREYINIIPDKLKDPALTRHFEENLHRVNTGEITKDMFLDELRQEFEEDMEHFISEKVTDTRKIGYYANDSDAPDYLGKCPQCGAAVKAGKFGAYCEGKCGMTFTLQGKKLTPAAVETLLSGGKLLVKGLVSRTKGTKYDAYFIADGTEPFSFTNKEGRQFSGYGFKYRMEFPVKKRGSKS